MTHVQSGMTHVHSGMTHVQSGMTHVHSGMQAGEIVCMCNKNIVQRSYLTVHRSVNVKWKKVFS